jgi:hypothetical protein
VGVAKSSSPSKTNIGRENFRPSSAILRDLVCDTSTSARIWP